MSATVQIDELNGAGAVTFGIRNMNAGNADTPNLIIAPNTAILAGNNSFVKYNRLNFTNMGGASVISNVKVWVTGLFGSETILTSLQNVSPPVFATPTSTLTPGNFVQTSLPGSGNLTIAGSLVGTLTGPGPTDIFYWQLQTTGSQHGYTAPKTWNFQWDEA